MKQNKITIPAFTKNQPGLDWVYCFIKRYKQELSVRKAQFIKRARAKVCRSNINKYFDNVTLELSDVPSSNIINFDETNVSDDPKKPQVIVSKSQSHAESVLNTSKSSHSVMLAAAGDGTLLPPYVVYKSKNLYESWTQYGPPGTRYNSSKSGWFETIHFQDWFISIALHYCKSLPNEKPKVLIGDNVATHLSVEVIKECIKHNIRFCFLPPNSTHLTQVLDLSFFKSFKAAFREVLLEWKMKNPQAGVLPKHIFPSLLRKVLQKMEPKLAKILKNGFRKAGLIPLNRNAVLKELPKEASGTEVTPGNVISVSLKLFIIFFFLNIKENFELYWRLITTTTKRFKVGLHSLNLKKFGRFPAIFLVGIDERLILNLHLNIATIYPSRC